MIERKVEHIVDQGCIASATARRRVLFVATVYTHLAGFPNPSQR